MTHDDLLVSSTTGGVSSSRSDGSGGAALGSVSPRSARAGGDGGEVGLSGNTAWKEERERVRSLDVRTIERLEGRIEKSADSHL